MNPIQLPYPPVLYQLDYLMIEHPRPPPTLHQFLRNISMILELRNVFTRKYFSKNTISGAILEVRRSNWYSENAY